MIEINIWQLLEELRKCPDIPEDIHDIAQRACNFPAEVVLIVEPRPNPAPPKSLGDLSAIQRDRIATVLAALCVAVKQTAELREVTLEEIKVYMWKDQSKIEHDLGILQRLGLVTQYNDPKTWYAHPEVMGRVSKSGSIVEIDRVLGVLA